MSRLRWSGVRSLRQRFLLVIVLGAVLPRSLSEGMARAMKADRVLAGADLDRRHDYELRAARSEPGLEPAPEQPQIPQAAAGGGD